MNGRVFDTNIGRFIQADIVNDSGIQGLNPYSYVLNNPFSLTDPSGYLSFGDALRIIVAVAISAVTGFYAVGLIAGNSILAGLGLAAIGGFASGYIMTGSFKGAVKGAWSAMAAAAIGGFIQSGGLADALSVTGNMADAAGVIAQGLTSGIVSELQGGNFGSAFLAAGAGGAVGLTTSPTGINFGDAIISAIAGGTISKLTGGDFANGALSSAMGYAMGAYLAQRGQAQDSNWTTRDQQAKDASIESYYDNGTEYMKKLGIQYEPKDGFALYGTIAPDGTHIVAFRGTDGWDDWKHNTTQGFLGSSKQYDQAAYYAFLISKATNGNVVFTGHSLGGGLAAAAAHATNGTAITFDAAGLHSNYRTGQPASIRAHFTQGDPVNTLHHMMPLLPKPIGTPIPHTVKPGYHGPIDRHDLRNFP